MNVQQILDDLAGGVNDDVWMRYGIALNGLGFFIMSVGVDASGPNIYEIVVGPGQVKRVERDARGLWTLVAL